MTCVCCHTFQTLELSLPDYTPEVSEYKVYYKDLACYATPPYGPHCLQEAAVLDYDASAKIVKLKLSEATLRKEMLKGDPSLDFSSVAGL